VTRLTGVKTGLSGGVVTRPITLREPRIDARTTEVRRGRHVSPADRGRTTRLAGHVCQYELPAPRPRANGLKAGGGRAGPWTSA
jgi:hypothetical protein